MTRAHDEVQRQIDWLINLRFEDIRSESEIKRFWGLDSGFPIVSVICNAYNHNEFIEDALKGFLIQQTDFPFEIIVHDDASSDGTTNIIEKYQRRFPSIIKPVIQSENQYSKGFKPTLLSYPYARGNYIALCEGDDFWFDPTKLSSQKRLLDAHPKVDLCIHPAVATDRKGNLKSIILSKMNQELIKPSVVIKGGGAWCATSSLFVRREIIKQFGENFNDAPVGDLFIQCLGAIRGGCVYSPAVSSVYRMGVPGNWSGKRGEPDRLESFYQKMQAALSQLGDLEGFSNYELELNILRSQASYAIGVDYFRLKNYKKSFFYLRESINYKPALNVRQILLFSFLAQLQLVMSFKRFVGNLL